MTEELPFARTGRKSLFEIYLDDNPELKRGVIEELEKQGKSLAGYREGDIFTLDALILYFGYELTKAKNEGVLRGKTLTDYSKAFIDLHERKQRIEIKKREEELKNLVILRNREEVDSFMRAVCEAIKNVIADIETRKKLADEIKKLYDEYYIRSRAQLPDKESTTGEPGKQDIKTE